MEWVYADLDRVVGRVVNSNLAHKNSFLPRSLGCVSLDRIARSRLRVEPARPLIAERPCHMARSAHKLQHRPAGCTGIKSGALGRRRRLELRNGKSHPGTPPMAVYSGSGPRGGCPLKKGPSPRVAARYAILRIEFSDRPFAKSWSMRPGKKSPRCKGRY